MDNKKSHINSRYSIRTENVWLCVLINIRRNEKHVQYHLRIICLARGRWLQCEVESTITNAYKRVHVVYNFLLGEKLSDPEVEQVLKDCMDPEDDDGFIPYARKYGSVSMKETHASRDIEEETKRVTRAAPVSH